MKISEIFHGIQGEGNTIGYPAIFIRFSQCNLDCSFCDSKYALGEEYTEMAIPEIMEEVKKYNCKRIVISGGESLIQFNDLRELCILLKLNNYQIEIETNGTIHPGELSLYVDTWHVSLKLSNSGVEEDKRLIPKVIKKFAAYACIQSDVEFKFVIGKKEDFLEMLDIINTYNILIESVCVMPCAIKEEGVLNIMKNLSSLCLEYNIRLLPRMHILLWGNKRGV